MGRPRPNRKTLGVTRPKLSPEQIRRAKSERADGMSWADLGRRFGMDASTVKAHVEAA